MHHKILLGPGTIYEFFFWKKIEGYKNYGFKNRDYRRHGCMHELHLI